MTQNLYYSVVIGLSFLLSLDLLIALRIHEEHDGAKWKCADNPCARARAVRRL
jgi:hypothetical protein